MFCPKCGREIADTAAFCTKCGAKLTGPAASAAALGETPEVPASASGAPLAGEAVEAQSQAKRKSHRTALVAAICTVAVVAVGAVVAFVLLGGGTPIDETNFPNASFRAYVAKTYDTDGNGRLSDREIASVTSMNLTQGADTSSITDINGIALFPDIEDVNLGDAPVENVDLTKNAEVKTVEWTGKVGKIDVAYNSKVKYEGTPDTKISDQGGNAVADSLETHALSNQQTYRGVTYTGCYNRVYGGTVTAIPNTTPFFAETDHFLFTKDGCVYTDRFKGNGTGKVNLYRANSDGSGKTVLAGDVNGGSTPCLCGYWIVYQSFDGAASFSIKKVNIGTGAEKTVDLPAVDSRYAYERDLVGATDSYLFYTDHDAASNGKCLYRCNVDGGDAKQLASGVDGYCAGTVSASSLLFTTASGKIECIDFDGKVLWTQTATAPAGGTSSMRLAGTDSKIPLVHDGKVYLYATTGSAQRLYVLSASDGSVAKTFDEQSMSGLFMVTDDTLYYCQLYSNNSYGIASNGFLYKMSLQDGSQTKVQ